MKTKKSILKRFKITKTGKILRRPTGIDHCRAKKSGKPSVIDVEIAFETPDAMKFIGIYKKSRGLFKNR